MNVTTCEPLSYDTAAGDMPEASRQPAREVCKPGAHFPESTAVPNVLLIGDSITQSFGDVARFRTELRRLVAGVSISMS